MVDQRLRELRGGGRRDFLRWGATVAACLGLERSRFLNVLGDNAGTAFADEAACASTSLSIHVVDGNGGLANWTQVFPIPEVIQSTNAAYSHYALGKGIATTGFNRPWMYAPDSPWQNDPKWNMTAFVAGTNETHTGTPVSAINVGNGVGMLAAAAAIQQANPTLLPVLSVGGVQFGAAPGAPPVAAVGSASQLVDLFNSTASQTLLMAPENGALGESYYKAFLGLYGASGRRTVAKQLGVGKTSMGLLAKNLAAQISPTTADRTLFGLDAAAVPGAVQNMSLAMIAALRSFSLGLSSSLLVTGFRDDPHGRFQGGDAQAAAYSQALGKMLNGLHDLAKSLPDPSCSAKTIADRMVLTAHGDTYKNPFNRNGWSDGTQQGSNVLYVMGGGYLKTGWLGEIAPAGVKGWDPSTGEIAGTYNTGGSSGAMLGNAASAAALYAVARGDLGRVNNFFTGGNLNGILNQNVTG